MLGYAITNLRTLKHLIYRILLIIFSNQLFLFIKLCDDQKLGTADAWLLTEIT